MDDIPTEKCARCDTEFDIDEGYREIQVIDKPHPEDVELGNVREDKLHTVCGSCAVNFRIWLDPEADSLQDLVDKSPGNLITNVPDSTSEQNKR